MGLIAEFSPIIALVIGFGLLILGGELLVRGAVQAAECLGVSPLMIGIVLVGFGTSAPEMAISVYAALLGSPGIAIGNFVGSSIANILLILGLSALFMPIGITPKALSRDGVVVIASAAAFCFIGIVYSLDRLVGFVFTVWLIWYLLYAWQQERELEGADNAGAAARRLEKTEEHLSDNKIAALLKAKMHEHMPLGSALFMAIAGLAILILGGQILVDGAVKLAESYGVSEEVIGLTIVAVGTSMPELVTSLVAALRRQSAVAVGNILGSNIYNILGVGGITGLLSPTPVPVQIAWYDNFIMIAASIALLVVARSGLRITRREGGIMLAAYVVYIWSLLPANASAG